MTRLLTAILLCVLPVASFSCQKRTVPAPAPPRGRADANVTQVKIMRNGDIVVDGNSTTIEGLRLVLEGTKSRSGRVWYYRESGETEITPIGAEVIRMVIEMRLPISLSTKPDFSDFVDDEGVSHPRP